MPASGMLSDQEASPRLGITFGYGHAYDPETIDWYQMGAMVLWDYEDVWQHPAPDPLRFKVEASLGANGRASHDFMASAGIAAVYYLDRLRTPHLRPFIEGGIGFIYTDYRIEDQGLNWNFNPQAGVGTEIVLSSHRSLWLSVRAHHLSNGGLNSDNRGVNGILFTIGWMF